MDVDIPQGSDKGLNTLRQEPNKPGYFGIHPFDSIVPVRSDIIRSKLINSSLLDPIKTPCLYAEANLKAKARTILQPRSLVVKIALFVHV